MPDQARGGRVAAHGVEVATLRAGAHEPRAGRGRQQADPHQPGDAEEGLLAQVDDGVRQLVGVDARATDDDGLEALDDVERAEGDDERRKPEPGDEEAVDQTHTDADSEAHQEDREDATVRLTLDRAACQVGSEAEGRSHGQVDVAHDDDEGLPDSHQPGDRDRDHQVGAPLGGQEVRVPQGGEDEDDDERQADGQLTRREERVQPAGGADSVGVSATWTVVTRGAPDRSPRA